MPSMLSWIKDRLARRTDSEHGQALTRILMVSLILGYELVSSHRWDMPASLLHYVVALTLISLLVSLGLFAWIVARPARSNLRRGLGMVADYSLMAMAMSAVGEPMACIYVVVMWVTIGNGLRYGNRYLYLAVAMAVVSFGITLNASDYWQRNFGLGVSLLLGLAAIPLYLSGLLRQLTRAMAEARRASEAKSRFLANMSHEFRTPLNGLSGMTDLLASTRLDAEQRECLNTIQASTRSLLSLVEEVLDISAIEAGKIRVEKRNFSLRSMLDGVGLILQPQARKKGLSYRMSYDPELPGEVCGDVGHVRQVLLNIAGNAVKFTDEGGISIDVSQVTSTNEYVRVRFDIRDTGIGIPAEMRQRLFDAFEQADTGLARRFEGSGLGTTIARGLVESMGGDIGFEDNLGGGSHFWFELPLLLADTRVPEAAVAMVQEGSELSMLQEQDNVIAFTDPFLRHRARVRSMHVLVADDHEANRMVLQRLLQKAGHKTTCVEGGEAVLDALADMDFDAAIVDLHMPGMSGLDLLKQLRVMQAGGGPRTPVMVLSADVTPDAIRSCEQAGAYAFLAKPLVAVKLLDLLAEIATNRDLPVGQARITVVRQEQSTDGVLDPTVLDELASLGMGEGFEREFIRQCLGDAQQGMVELQAAAQRQDWEQVREHAHAIKGVSSNLGLVALAELGGTVMKLTHLEIKRSWPQHLEAMQAALAVGRRALDARQLKAQQSESRSDQT